MTPMDLTGRTALVTGAASGIGRGIALALAQRGCHLALADIDEAGLTDTARLLSPNRRATRHVIDLTDRAAIAALPQEIAARHGGLDILVNNAGVAIAGTFDQVSEPDFEWLFEINFWAMVRMTRAFMPLLRTSDDARIVYLSSVFGLIAPPGQTAYAASKFAVRGFANALRQELRGSAIGVTVVHPGGVATQIADAARWPEGTPRKEMERETARARRVLTMPPQAAGEIIVAGIERRVPRLLVGRDARILNLIERFAPVSCWAVVERLIGRK